MLNEEHAIRIDSLDKILGIKFYEKSSTAQIPGNYIIYSGKRGIKSRHNIIISDNSNEKQISLYFRNDV